MPEASRGLYAWCKLLRVPNLFTVPGDAVAGYLLASGGSFGAEVFHACGAVLAIYAGGLLLNDYFDREEDARDRPDRPIPSGAVKPQAVLLAGAAALPAGVVLASLGGVRAGLIAAGVALVALLYDAALKKLPVIGPVMMGICRGGSVMVGAGLAGGENYAAALPAAGIVALYTAALTWNAAGEVSGKKPGAAAFAPGVVLLAGWALVCRPGLVERAFSVAVAVVLGLAVAEASWAALRVLGRNTAVPAFIGRLVRVMITVQAAMALWALPAARWQVVGAVIGAFATLRLGSEVFGRRFYAS